MTTETVWKVVREKDEKLYSASTHGGFTIQYKPGEEAKPEIGGIFAFFSYTSALGFYYACDIATIEHYQLWKAEASRVRESPSWIPVSCLSFHVARFWSLLDEYDNQFEDMREVLMSLPLTIMKPPQGTVICESITLRERVK